MLTLISPEERLSALQARCCDPEPELEAQTPKRLFQQLRKRLLEAHERDGVLASSWNDVLGLVKISPRPEKLGDHDVFLITGGMKNQHRDPKIAHLRRTDGAWFDFSVAVSSRRGPLRLIGYNFELRFPEPARVRWIRYDLSPPGHPNDARDLRSHMHPGDDDIQLPAPMMSPLELLDLFLVWTPLPERPQHG
ncbi:MAG: hypothetical protein H6739_12205 [Alphaproteobacteria bacterium]|nr:hypothetical protein [Alphaproteobacteria bacterium]